MFLCEVARSVCVDVVFVQRVEVNVSGVQSSCSCFYSHIHQDPEICNAYLTSFTLHNLLHPCYRGLHLLHFLYFTFSSPLLPILALLFPSCISPNFLCPAPSLASFLYFTSFYFLHLPHFLLLIVLILHLM